MRNLLVLLAGFVLAATVFCLPALADDVQPTLDRLAKMSFAEQQTWLLQLEQRAERAARIALPPEQAEREQAEISGLLRRELITWTALREAIVKTESLENRARDKLLEQYRALGINNEEMPPDVKQPRKAETPERVETARPREPKPTPAPILKPLPELAAGPMPNTAGDKKRQPPEQFAPERVVEKPAEPSPPRELADRKPPAPRQRGPFGVPMETRVEPPTRIRPQSGAVAPRDMPPGTVKINADELSVRVAGCNMAFRALESELDEDGQWDAQRIEPLLEKLEILSVRRNDLELYRDLLSDGEQSKVAKLETPKSATSQLGKRIFEARRSAASPEFEGTETERRAELGRLEMLSRRLAKAAGENKDAAN
ncbi:MAG: hypothetical protein GX594_04185 [Pirellulaceae bacterium]|nr:hypothetical protein [Pirellulaceae bacterium]